MLSIPTRAQIEALQLEQLQIQVRDTLTGERLASFLPIVSELSEQYDAHAIAAAALQMAYDQTRPSWLETEEIPEEQFNKPKLRTSSRTSGGRHRSSGDGDKRTSNSSKPKLKTSCREASILLAIIQILTIQTIKKADKVCIIVIYLD